MNPTRLQPVLITGCSSGIGKACALRLARHGWIVYAAVRDPTHTPDLHAGGCRTVLLDVTDETSMSEAVNVIEAEHGPVGAVVHNAGTSLVGPVESLTRRGHRARRGPGGGSLAHTLAFDHSEKRRWAVAPEGPNGAVGSCCQVQPEVATNTIAASTSRSPCRRRPPP